MNPHELLPRSQVANLLGQSHQAMADMATKGYGPPCYGGRRGKGVQASYRRADVHTFAQARAAGLSQRDASIWTCREAWRLTCQTIEARYGASDPEFAGAQRRVAHLQLTRQLQRIGVAVEALDHECLRIDALMIGLPPAA